LQPEALVNLRLLELAEVLLKERRNFKFKAYIGLLLFFGLLFLYSEFISHYLFSLPGNYLDTLLWLSGISVFLVLLSVLASPLFLNSLLKPKLLVLQFYPDFKKIIEIMLRRTNIKKVDFYVSHHLSRNAMVYREAGRYRIVFAADLMDLLTPSEFAGVLGHELGHIYNKDLYLNSMLWLGFRVLGVVKQLSFVFILASSRLISTLSKAKDKYKDLSFIKMSPHYYSNIIAMLLALPIGLLLFFLGMLLLIFGLFLNLGIAIFNLINKSREYAADLYSAIYSSPHCVCQGLKKIFYLNQNTQSPVFRFPEYCTLGSETDSMAQPDIYEYIKGTLSSHPFTYNRLRRLRKYEEIEERLLTRAKDFSALVRFPKGRRKKIKIPPSLQLTLPL
jgi:Zn-dependent protease with chaperone function